MVLLTMISEQRFNDTLKTLISAAYDAGDAIMAVFKRSHVERQYKDDASPVTEADEAAERMILKALQVHFPAIQVVAEEHSLNIDDLDIKAEEVINKKDGSILMDFDKALEKRF